MTEIKELKETYIQKDTNIVLNEYKEHINDFNRAKALVEVEEHFNKWRAKDDIKSGFLVYILYKGKSIILYMHNDVLFEKIYKEIDELMDMKGDRVNEVRYMFSDYDFVLDIDSFTENKAMLVKIIPLDYLKNWEIINRILDLVNTIKENSDFYDKKDLIEELFNIYEKFF